ncbi:MAG: hypothetical protein ACOYMN_10530 [Roseimicrobium sp.]
MSLLRHWKLVLGLMAIFGAGVGTGAVGTVVLLQRIFTRPEPAKRWADSRLGELEARLKLSPQQKEKLRPIIEDASQRFREIGAETFSKIMATAEQTQGRFASVLSPEQQVEFQRMRPQVTAKLRELAQREINVKAHGQRSEAPVRPEMEAPEKTPSAPAVP